MLSHDRVQTHHHRNARWATAPPLLSDLPAHHLADLGGRDLPETAIAQRAHNDWRSLRRTDDRQYRLPFVMPILGHEQALSQSGLKDFEEARANYATDPIQAGGSRVELISALRQHCAFGVRNVP
jgi:hypothetical protein